MTSWTDYAVEIRIPLGKEYRVGSGYLIGPGLILTALHVVVGSLENCSEIVAPSPILIRAYGDFHAAFGELLGWNSRDLLNKMAVAAPDGDFRWRTATLVWPANNTSPPRFDAALLEVAPSDRLPHVAAPRSITCLDPIGRVSCEGMGFPIWGWTKTEEGKSLSSPITVSADLSDGAQGSDGMRALTVLRSSTPRQESDWEGLSGTAFLDDASHELLGIVSRTQDSSRNDALRLALLSDFWGPDMAGFWKRSRLPRPTPAGLESWLSCRRDQSGEISSPVAQLSPDLRRTKFVGRDSDIDSLRKWLDASSLVARRRKDSARHRSR